MQVIDPAAITAGEIDVRYLSIQDALGGVSDDSLIVRDPESVEARCVERQHC